MTDDSAGDDKETGGTNCSAAAAAATTADGLDPPSPVTSAEDAASVFRYYRDSTQNKRLPSAVAFALAAPPKLKLQLWDSIQHMLCSSPRQNFVYPLLAVLPQFAPQNDAGVLIDTTFQYLTSAPTLGKRQAMEMLKSALSTLSSNPRAASLVIERLFSKLVSKGPLERLRSECLDLLEEVVRLCVSSTARGVDVHLRCALCRHRNLVAQRHSESDAWRGSAKMRKRMAAIADFVNAIEQGDTLADDPGHVDGQLDSAEDAPAAQSVSKGKADSLRVLIRSDLDASGVSGCGLPKVESPTCINSPPPKKLRQRNDLAISLVAERDT